MLPLCIYNTTGPCMQYSTDPCTYCTIALMYTVLNVPVKSTSDMCIQYFWSVYTELNIPVYSILLGNANCTIGPSCRLLVHIYTGLLVHVYSVTGP